MQRFMKALAALMLTVTAMLAVGFTKPDAPNKEGNSVNNVNGTYNGHEYVDLGLPSGTLWATCNVGASKPEQYGDYFAWGETKPKATYDWKTYKYCNNGDFEQLTKYCSKFEYGYHGFTDNLTVLQPQDDAATTNWGSGWCTPTKEQWKELEENTTNTWKTWDGVEGRLFKGNNGEVLFLPAAGYRWDGGLDDAGSYGGYWSSSLHTDDPNTAWEFYFDSDYYYVYDYGRYDGLTVRPVRSARQN